MFASLLIAWPKRKTEGVQNTRTTSSFPLASLQRVNTQVIPRNWWPPWTKGVGGEGAPWKLDLENCHLQSRSLDTALEFSVPMSVDWCRETFRTSCLPRCTCVTGSLSKPVTWSSTWPTHKPGGWVPTLFRCRLVTSEGSELRLWRHKTPSAAKAKNQVPGR